MLLIDYAKSKDCILCVHPWLNEGQQRVNNSWTCILGNLGGDGLQTVINEVLAAFIGKRDMEKLPAPLW